ncbi:LHFPL tetraspan subfamily member 2a protein [Arctopsyche grandis]|uniref:LHFPL tetraspan subfamily member 2a protein n=1 Tax=Arctopsyche grandis TaxID=121162 RepID=UPI00406D74CB
MCYVIVTGRGIFWLLLNLVATMSTLLALLTPKWVIGPMKIKNLENDTIIYTPTVGIYNRCTLINGRNHCGPFSLEGFATDDVVFPAVWKACFFFIALGLTINSLTLISGVMSFCFRAICRKSIFSLSGTIQALAGVCIISGMVLYPWGWGSPRVQRLCGPDASPFSLGDCTVGWAFYCGAVGVILTFISGTFSIVAEKAVSSEKVQQHIRKGKTLICLP